MEKRIIGTDIANQIKDSIQQEIVKLQRAPHLVVIVVGNDPASAIYVKNKEKACEKVGMTSTKIALDETISEEDLLKRIEMLNIDESVDGILVQLPLPKHIREDVVTEAIDPRKDADGFHPYNVGLLYQGKETIEPCTPKGIMVMLEHIGLKDLSGKHVVVMGRSNIVGKPVAQLCLNRNATISIVHSKTKDIKSITKQADILIVAIGKAKMVDASYMKDGVIVIDVGIHRNDEGKLCGDVDFDDVYDKVSYITPVPRGVGPMTIAMLLQNTMDNYKRNGGN